MSEKERTILVADDEKDIRDVVSLLLRGDGYNVLTACSGNEVLDKMSSGIDLLILDINMPGLSGIMTASEIRKHYDTPIIFLTAYSSEGDKVMGFSAGADDYIVKPFSNIELLMRVKAILKRRAVIREANINDRGIVIEDLVLNRDMKTVSRDGETIPFTYTEYMILELLAVNRKKIFSLDNIYTSIWAENAVGDSAIMVHIKNIRKKLGDDSRNPKYIKTAWGRGYYID